MKNILFTCACVYVYVFMCVCTFSCSLLKHPSYEQYLLNISVPLSRTSSIHHLSDKKLKPIVIDKISITSPFDQLNFIYRASSSRYLVDYYHRFMVSPAKQLYPVLITYLQNSGKFMPILSEAAEAIQAVNEKKTFLRLKTEIRELYADYQDTLHPKSIVVIHIVLFKIKRQQNEKVVILLDKTLKSVQFLKHKDTENLLDAFNKSFEELFNEVLKYL